MTFPAIALAVTITGLAYAQPAFEAASIRLNRSGDNGALTMTSGRIDFRSATLQECVIAAYGLREYQIAASGLWTAIGYDISANAAGPATDAELRGMLKTLLAERFQLKLHFETRELPAYRLVTSKNRSGLTPSATDQPGGYTLDGGAVTFHNTSMKAFAEYLSRRGPIDRPVFDGTGVAGVFDFRLKLFEVQSDMPLDALKRAYHEWDQGVSIFTDLQEQLGLRLQAEKAPIEVLVIDSVAKPSEN